MMSEAKANMARIVLYDLKRKRAGEATSYLIAWQRAALLYAAQNGGYEPETGRRRKEYITQGKQMEESRNYREMTLRPFVSSKV